MKKALFFDFLAPLAPWRPWRDVCCDCVTRRGYECSGESGRGGPDARTASSQTAFSPRTVTTGRRRGRLQKKRQLELSDAALRPVIAAACKRVEIKTAKAFEAHEKTTGEAWTIWLNVFAEEQGRYASDSLAPVADALRALGGNAIDVQQVAERYAYAVRQRGTTEQAKTLQQIVDEVAAAVAS